MIILDAINNMKLLIDVDDDNNDDNIYPLLP